jgi:16S rRNA (guanine(966)-N(2))-methyltransferase RsmD
MRETLFNILARRIEGVTFLDAYAGTGAVGIEALSRGARHAFFLERDRHALEAIRENLASLGLERRATVVAGPVLVTMISSSSTRLTTSNANTGPRWSRCPRRRRRWSWRSTRCGWR